MQGLERFIEAQAEIYPQALAEVTRGRKRTHWMWYIFPQLKDLGFSDTAKFYGIATLAEAKEYLAHPLLSQRLYEITNALLAQEERDAVKIFGDIDALKLRSAMTLFAIASEGNSAFCVVLEEFYHNDWDQATIDILKNQLPESEQFAFIGECILKRYRKAFEVLGNC